MKDLSAIAGELAKPLGTEPLTVVTVTWGFTGPEVTYLDKDHALGKGKILSVSGLDDTVKIGTTGGAGNISITLDDSDGSIRQIMETNDIHKSFCQVSQTFEPLGAQSILFTGELASEISWNEAERTVSFEVVGRIESKEIGFSAETGEFDFIADSAIGRAWPLCFGSPLKVPALKLTEGVRGTSLSRYSLITQADLNSLCSAAQTQTDADVDKKIADTNAGLSDANYDLVLENLTGATIALNTALSGLVFTSPSREGDLLAYIQACKNLRLAERNQVLYSGQVLALNVQILPLQTSLDTAEAALAVELNKPLPDFTVVATLQAEIETIKFGTANNGLESLETQKLSSQSNLAAANSNINIFTSQKENLEVTLTQIDLTSLEIEGGEEFPQGVPIKVIINGAKFGGSFSGQTFTITDPSLPTNTNVALGPRQNANTNEFWLADPTIDIRGMYCYFGGVGVVYVESQQGTHCFISPIVYQNVGTLTLIGDIQRDIYDPLELGGIISETGVIFRNHWTAALRAVGPDSTTGISNIRSTSYTINVGDSVYLDTDYKDLYIANLIESTVIQGVFAFRTINGVKKLQPVPSRYFDINLAESIAGQTSTTVRFKKPLGQYVDEQWEEQIYVSLTSTVGPNTAEVIDYLVINYTNFTSDVLTLASTVSALAKYPSNFAMLERRDALDAIQDIAWQARCAVYLFNETFVYKYLATEETKVQTITESEILLGSMSVALTSTEDLVTKLTAEWKIDLAQEKPHRVVIRNNITKYGTIEETYDFFIYNIKELVTKSLSFWMFRYSNTYKLIRFTSFMKTLELQIFDTVEFTFIDDYIANGSVNGIVQKATYNSENQIIEYEVLVSVRAGEMDAYPFFWSADSSGSYPGVTDIYAGGGQ